MTTINTIQDLNRILRDHPEWREELRRTLLTEELLELPERFSAFVAEMREFAEVTNTRLDRLTASVQANTDAIAELRQSVQANTDAIAELRVSVQANTDAIAELRVSVQANTDAIAELRVSVQANTDAIAELRQSVSELRQITSDLHGETRLNSRHIAGFKGVMLERFAADEWLFIADEMGLSLSSTQSLARQEIFDLSFTATDEGKTGGIRRGQLVSFRKADMIMKTVDRRGEDCYIAVEVSYTADSRDTDRAIRNSEYLTRFTGINAYPVVASVRVDRRIKDILTDISPIADGAVSGKVFWYEMSEPEIDLE